MNETHNTSRISASSNEAVARQYVGELLNKVGEMQTEQY